MKSYLLFFIVFLVLNLNCGSTEQSHHKLNNLVDITSPYIFLFCVYKASKNDRALIPLLISCGAANSLSFLINNYNKLTKKTDFHNAFNKLQALRIDENKNKDEIEICELELEKIRSSFAIRRKIMNFSQNLLGVAGTLCGVLALRNSFK